MDSGSTYTAIGSLAQRTGANVETIRYYERVGLLPAPARSAGGYRLYGIAHVKRLMFIRRARPRLLDRRGPNTAEARRRAQAAVRGGSRRC